MGLVREYFDNSQFHGFRFLTQPDRHWIERIFWVICIGGSWSLCFLLILNSYDSYQNNALSFGSDTDFIEWNTPFFTIAVCENKNKDGVYALGQKLWGKNHDYNLDEILNEIVYFKGDHYFTKVFCSNGPKKLPCPTHDFKNLSDMVRRSCTEVFEDCMWNDSYFVCCKFFLPIQTEVGLCYAINSLNTMGKHKAPLISNKTTGPGYMTLTIKVTADIYTLAPEDVPSLNAPSTNIVPAVPGLHKKKAFSLTEITNEPLVSDVSVSKRSCKFGWENEGDYYPVYSQSSCLVSCRKRKQLEICNCASHLIPGTDVSVHCNISGLNCLIDNFLEYAVLVSPGSNSKGLSCDCLPSCTEPESVLISQEEYGIGGKNGMVVISLQQLPTMRLKRTVVRGPLDLVVSIGGSFGLCVGASLLSFVELFYYCTIRVYWHYKTKRDPKKQLQEFNPSLKETLILELDKFGNPIENFHYID